MFQPFESESGYRYLSIKLTTAPFLLHVTITDEYAEDAREFKVESKNEFAKNTGEINFLTDDNINTEFNKIINNLNEINKKLINVYRPIKLGKVINFNDINNEIVLINNKFKYTLPISKIDSADEKLSILRMLHKRNVLFSSIQCKNIQILNDDIEIKNKIIKTLAESNFNSFENNNKNVDILKHKKICGMFSDHIKPRLTSDGNDCLERLSDILNHSTDIDISNDSRNPINDSIWFKYWRVLNINISKKDNGEAENNERALKRRKIS